VRLEGHGAAGNAALGRLGLEQAQHGLMSPVYTIKIANGHSAGRSQAGMIDAAENLHGLLCYL
jgi:hypothetical protein